MLALLRAVFDTADALLISEVKMLLEHRKAQYETQEEDHELSEVQPPLYFPASLFIVVFVCLSRFLQRLWTTVRPSASTTAKRPSLQ